MINKWNNFWCTRINKKNVTINDIIDHTSRCWVYRAFIFELVLGITGTIVFLTSIYSTNQSFMDNILLSAYHSFKLVVISSSAALIAIYTLEKALNSDKFWNGINHIEETYERNVNKVIGFISVFMSIITKPFVTIFNKVKNVKVASCQKDEKLDR